MTQKAVATQAKRPTLKTVAQIADLAVTTVSRALADDPKIALATRERVAAIAEQVGYVPDRAAQRLRTGKTKVISLILEPHQEILGFGDALIHGITGALHDTRYHLNITPSFAGGDTRTTVEHIVHNRLADGLIFARTRPFDERVRYLSEQGFPFACHGRTELSAPYSHFDFDNESFAFAAANRLTEKGVQKICLILPPDKFTFYQHLRYGLLRSVRTSGLEYCFPEEITLDSSLVQIKDWARDLAGHPDAPDGFICPGEASYLALTNGMRLAGKQRGRDFEAVVKTSSDLMSQIDPTVDQIFEDIEEAGARLAAFVLGQLSKDDPERAQAIQSPVVRFSH